MCYICYIEFNELITYQILNIKNPYQYRILFEKVIPRLAILLGLDEKCNYEDIVVSFLEYAAKK